MLEIHKNRQGAAATVPQKIPHLCTVGVVVLNLPSPSLTVGQNYQTLPKHFYGYFIRPLLAVGYGLCLALS